MGDSLVMTQEQIKHIHEPEQISKEKETNKSRIIPIEIEDDSVAVKALENVKHIHEDEQIKDEIETDKSKEAEVVQKRKGDIEVCKSLVTQPKKIGRIIPIEIEVENDDNEHILDETKVLETS